MGKSFEEIGIRRNQKLVGIRAFDKISEKKNDKMEMKIRQNKCHGNLFGQMVKGNSSINILVNNCCWNVKRRSQKRNNITGNLESNASGIREFNSSFHFNLLSLFLIFFCSKKLTLKTTTFRSPN